MLVSFGRDKQAGLLREAGFELMHHLIDPKRNTPLGGDQKTTHDDRFEFDFIRDEDFFIATLQLENSEIQGVGAMYGIKTELIDILFGDGGAIEVEHTSQSSGFEARLSDDELLDINTLEKRSVVLSVRNAYKDNIHRAVKLGGSYSSEFAAAALELAERPDFVIGVCAFAAHLANPKST